jgi:hypothetical protein
MSQCHRTLWRQFSNRVGGGVVALVGCILLCHLVNSPQLRVEALPAAITSAVPIHRAIGARTVPSLANKQRGCACQAT